MDDPIVIIQDLTTASGDKVEVSATKLVAAARYYEWNDRDKIWMKLIPNDPEPPSNMPDGKFDGQIIEIRKGSVQP